MTPFFNVDILTIKKKQATQKSEQNEEEKARKPIGKSRVVSKNSLLNKLINKKEINTLKPVIYLCKKCVKYRKHVKQKNDAHKSIKNYI